MESTAPSSFFRELKLEKTKLDHRGRSGRLKSHHDVVHTNGSMSSSDFIKQREWSGRSTSPTKPPLVTSSSHRRSRRLNEYAIENHSDHSSKGGKGGKGSKFDYESPTESLSSSLSSFQAELTNSNHSTSSRREKDHLSDDTMNGMNNENTNGAVISSENGAMIEVAKITALVEEELQSQRHKHKDQLNRVAAKFKERKEKFQREIDQLRIERDEARRELEHSKRDHASQRLAAERHDRLQSQQKNRIEILEEERELFEALQKERDALLDEVARTQQQQQKTKDELSALKVRVRQDSQKRLSVMESLSISWDTEKKEAQLKEELLTTELEKVTERLKAEQEFLKNKNNEFSQLETQYRSTRTELLSIKMSMGSKKEEMYADLIRERESIKKLSEEHKQILAVKNNEIYNAETTIRSLRAELQSARENFSLKKESSARSTESMKRNEEKVGIENNDVSDPEVKILREENSRLGAEIKELQKQVESYLANMALQQEFCDSLKSRIYTEQEKEQGQVEEMHKLRKQIKKQQKEATEKDAEIERLKQLLKESTSGGGSFKVKSKSSSRNDQVEKKSRAKKPKSSSSRSSRSRNSGYRTS